MPFQVEDYAHARQENQSTAVDQPALDFAARVEADPAVALADPAVAGPAALADLACPVDLGFADPVDLGFAYPAGLAYPCSHRLRFPVEDSS